MRSLILIVVLGILLAIVGATVEAVGIGVPLNDRKSRFVTALVISPIAVLCAMFISYSYFTWPLWLTLMIAVCIVALGVAAGIYLVGRTLPAKISNREP